MLNGIINKAKSHFLKTFENRSCSVYPYLPRHVSEAKKWAERILENYPEADKEIVLLSVWLHDIGRAIGEENVDHAVKSEVEARRFLSQIKVAPEKIEKVAHCIRAHRCRDVQPETLEAKILAAADSTSHMTDIDYIVMFSFMPKDSIIAKLERDYRDVGLFPELQKEITPLYEAWRKLLSVYLA